MRLLLTIAWLCAVVGFFRFWDVTYLVPPLAGWALGAVLLFVVTHRLAAGSWRLTRDGTTRVAIWLGVIAVALAGNLLVPTVEIRDALVHTVVFVKVVDTVVPLWIAAAALMVLWSGVRRVLALAGLVATLAIGIWFFVVAMPGQSAGERVVAPSPARAALATTLESDVRVLAALGERSVRRLAVLDSAALHIARAFAAAGYAVERQPFEVDGRTVYNLEVVLPGTTAADEVVVIGAHYDTAEGAPGADDNASGTAALLALARSFAGRPQARTIRFVAFTTEEPPHFNSPRMGSRVYAARAGRRGERLTAMLSLETVGYFSDEPGSQRYPPPFSYFYPDRGTFVGFVGNLASRPLVRRAIGVFRGASDLPSEGAALPGFIPGASWSDHASFWVEGYQAIMITDTAPFRNPHYHLASDTPDRLDYGRMARLVEGLVPVVEDLATR